MKKMLYFETMENLLQVLADKHRYNGGVSVKLFMLNISYYILYYGICFVGSGYISIQYKYKFYVIKNG